MEKTRSQQPKENIEGPRSLGRFVTELALRKSGNPKTYEAARSWEVQAQAFSHAEPPPQGITTPNPTCQRVDIVTEPTLPEPSLLIELTANGADPVAIAARYLRQTGETKLPQEFLNGLNEQGLSTYDFERAVEEAAQLYNQVCPGIKGECTRYSIGLPASSRSLQKASPSQAAGMITKTAIWPVEKREDYIVPELQDLLWDLVVLHMTLNGGSPIDLAPFGEWVNKMDADALRNAVALMGNIVFSGQFPKYMVPVIATTGAPRSLKTSSSFTLRQQFPQLDYTSTDCFSPTEEAAKQSRSYEEYVEMIEKVKLLNFRYVGPDFFMKHAMRAMHARTASNFANPNRYHRKKAILVDAPPVLVHTVCDKDDPNHEQPVIGPNGMPYLFGPGIPKGQHVVSGSGIAPATACSALTADGLIIFGPQPWFSTLELARLSHTPAAVFCTPYGMRERLGKYTDLVKFALFHPEAQSNLPAEISQLVEVYRPQIALELSTAIAVQAVAKEDTLREQAYRIIRHLVSEHRIVTPEDPSHLDGPVKLDTGYLEALGITNQPWIKALLEPEVADRIAGQVPSSDPNLIRALTRVDPSDFATTVHQLKIFAKVSSSNIAIEHLLSGGLNVPDLDTIVLQMLHESVDDQAISPSLEHHVLRQMVFGEVLRKLQYPS